MLDTLENETSFEDEKVTMNDIRRKMEAFVNMKDNIKKVYSIVIDLDVSKVVSNVTQYLLLRTFMEFF